MIPDPEDEYEVKALMSPQSTFSSCSGAEPTEDTLAVSCFACLRCEKYMQHVRRWSTKSNAQFQCVSRTGSSCVVLCLNLHQN